MGISILGLVEWGFCERLNRPFPGLGVNRKHISLAVCRIPVFTSGLSHTDKVVATALQSGRNVELWRSPCNFSGILALPIRTTAWHKESLSGHYGTLFTVNR